MKRSAATIEEIERPAGTAAHRALEEKNLGRNLLRSVGVVGAMPYILAKDAMATKLSKEDKAQLVRESRRGGKEDDDYGSRPDDKPFKNGGKVSSASKRADGIAQRGKTRA